MDVKRKGTEAGFCSQMKGSKGIELFAGLPGGCWSTKPGLSPSSRALGSTSVKTMTGSFFQLTEEHPEKALARQRMTHADSTAGEGYKVIISLKDSY